jgi:hypothetical protein
MRTHLVSRPSVDVVILTGQRKPLRFSYKRLALLQELQAEIPDLPVSCLISGLPKVVEIISIDLWDMRFINMVNLPDCA